MYLALVPALLLLAACAGESAAPRVAFPQVKVGEEFSLRLGETVDLQERAVLIRFEEVQQDSRCAVGVQCIWAGNARIRVEFMEIAGSGNDIDATGSSILLNTSTRFPTRDRYGDLAVELRRLEPTPKAETQTTGYIATLLVGKP